MAEARFARKLAAILYADVAGYSRLTGEDEEGTHQILRQSLALLAANIERHGGRVVHYAGDAVLADFAVASGALQSAMEVQVELARRNQGLPEDRKLQFRIGINLGEVLIDRHEIHGDDVNVAARLETIAEPGGVCVSESVRAAVGKMLPVEFESIGDRSLKNIAHPVHAYFVRPRPGVEWTPLDDVDPDAVVEAPEPYGDSPSITVLPFVNLSGDEAEQYFCDGITEDITTELARFRSLSVVGRTSSFQYRNNPGDLRKIGRELGAAYMLEGSVRRLDDRIRISAQLIESDGGMHIWADRYDRPADEIFQVQDELVSQIVGTLEKRVVHDRLGVGRRRPAASWKAYDYWLRGSQLMDQWSAAADTEAIPLLEKAIALDPGFARAYASLAGIYNSRTLLTPGNPSDVEDRARGFEYARKAVSLDPGDARGHIDLAWSHMLARDFENGHRHFCLAGELNPNDANITIARALGMAYLGDPQHGLELAAHAFRLNPLHPDYYLGNQATIAFLAGRYEDAVRTINLAPEVWPEIAAWHAAAYAHLGRIDEARAAADRFVRFVGAKWSGTASGTPAAYVRWLLQINAIRRAADIDRLLQGLELAGLPRPELPAPQAGGA